MTFDIPRIRTAHVCPPIPVRHFDWIAHYECDDIDDNGRMAYGSGETESEAIACLIEEYPR